MKRGCHYEPSRVYYPSLTEPGDKKKHTMHRTKGVRQAIVARQVCLYRFFSLAGVPGSERQAVLKLKIEQWSPWSDFGCWLAYTGVGAMVWIWDEQGLQTPRPVIPETVLQSGTQSVDGLHLQRCVQGWELQYWDGHQLLHSRWYATQPSPAECLSWAEWLGVVGGDRVQRVSEPSLNAVPWAKNAYRSRQDVMAWTGGFVGAGLVVLAAIYAGLMVSVYQWQKENQRLETQYAQLLSDARPLLDKRHHYETAKQQWEQLHLLAPAQYQSELFLSVLSALQQGQCQPCELVRWQYDGLLLDVVVKTQSLESKRVVEHLYKNQSFTNVSISPNRRQNEVQLALELKGR